MCTELLWNGKNEENGTEVEHGQFTGTAEAGQRLFPSFRPPLSHLGSARARPSMGQGHKKDQMRAQAALLP